MTRTRDVATQGGLVLITSQTIGSAVSSVIVNNVFSSTYDNYKILISGGVGSNTVDVKMTLGSTTSGYYSARDYIAWGGSRTFLTDNNAASWGAVGYADGNGLQASIELNNPFLTTRTVFSSPVNYRAGGFAACGGYLNDATSYTAFTIGPASGTITGGTIKVYGYK
jgi:hypothetical protein